LPATFLENPTVRGIAAAITNDAHGPADARDD
jgi:hypothetical protein